MEESRLTPPQILGNMCETFPARNHGLRALQGRGRRKRDRHKLEKGGAEDKFAISLVLEALFSP